MSDILQSIDPSNGELLGSVKTHAESEITQMVTAANTAAQSWGFLTIDQRLQAIEKAYSSAVPAISQLATLLSREMGKDIRRATGEVHGTVYGGPYIAESVKQAIEPSQIGRTRIEYKPFGVVAVISPWNYPLAMATNLIIPALVAGNAVVWKPSEHTPLIAQKLFESLAPHFPENVLQIIHGDGVQGRILVESEVNMVAFTGSQAVGKDIMQRASASLKRLVMELGGNDPMIVMADADIEAAARFAVASSFENSGQMCTSTERIYIDQAIAERFEQSVVAIARNYRTGPWDMDGVNIGPIINDVQHEKIVHHIKNAVDHGAKLLLGSADQQPPYIQPTVISNMKPAMLIEQVETFGPLVCIDRYSDIEKAIQRANNSSYGLGGVVFGSAGAQAVADRLEAGMVGINQGVGGEGDAPWVGAKQSGFGFHGSADGHKQFAQIRIVNQ
ncbi:MAG: aldehyde dehydrogenase family protein [Desulfobulbaceae bacterium]|nr:MAG: aldehyde dehydrogenase family protein [Desulfobulbaceae bacterium]